MIIEHIVKGEARLINLLTLIDAEVLGGIKAKGLQEYAIAKWRKAHWTIGVDYSIAGIIDIIIIPPAKGRDRVNSIIELLKKIDSELIKNGGGVGYYKINTNKIPDYKGEYMIIRNGDSVIIITYDLETLRGILGKLIGWWF